MVHFLLYLKSGFWTQSRSGPRNDEIVKVLYQREFSSRPRRQMRPLRMSADLGSVHQWAASLHPRTSAFRQYFRQAGTVSKASQKEGAGFHPHHRRRIIAAANTEHGRA